MARVSSWLGEQDLQPSAFTAEAAERFRHGHRERYSHLTGARALRSLLAYLRGLEVVPEPVVVDTPVERLLADYRDYLVRERGWWPGRCVYASESRESSWLSCRSRSRSRCASLSPAA